MKNQYDIVPAIELENGKLLKKLGDGEVSNKYYFIKKTFVKQI